MSQGNLAEQVEEHVDDLLETAALTLHTHHGDQRQAAWVHTMALLGNEANDRTALAFWVAALAQRLHEESSAGR